MIDQQRWNTYLGPYSPPLRAKCRGILCDNEIYSGSCSIYRKTKGEPNSDYGHTSFFLVYFIWYIYVYIYTKQSRLKRRRIYISPIIPFCSRIQGLTGLNFENTRGAVKTQKSKAQRNSNCCR